MKCIVLLFSVCILCTSCYSYQPLTGTPTQITTGIKYHFDLKNGKEFNKKIDSVGKDAYYITKSGDVKAIPFSEVLKLEKGKFSTWRTIGFSGLAILASTTIVAIIAFLSNW